MEGIEAGVLEQARLLLGGAPDEGALAFTVTLSLDTIKSYCNLDAVPDRLKTVAAAIAVDAYRQGQYGREQMETQEKSVTRGDTSFSFLTPAEQLAGAVQSPGFLKDYARQLAPFRKLRW